MRMVPACLIIALISAAMFSSTCTAAPVMVEKNLFAEDRKPPSPEAAPPPAQTNRPAVSPNSFQLDGVIIYGDTKKAIIRVKGQIPGEERRKGASPYMTIKEGEKVGGYVVSKIEPRSIILERDGQAHELRLFAEGKVSPPPPPMPAPEAQPVLPGQPAHQPGMPVPPMGTGAVPQQPQVAEPHAPGMPGAPQAPMSPQGTDVAVAPPVVTQPGMVPEQALIDVAPGEEGVSPEDDPNMPPEDVIIPEEEGPYEELPPEDAQP